MQRIRPFLVLLLACSAASSLAFAPSHLTLRQSSHARSTVTCSASTERESNDFQKLPLPSRRHFVSSLLPLVGGITLASPSLAEEEAKKEDPAKMTIYGEDAGKFLSEVAATGFGFFVVLSPTLLRAFGVIGESEEDKEKYPDRLWTIDGKNLDGTPAESTPGAPPEAESPSSGKSL
eukprot:CAMPEP_0181326484 /NCGR_PEP_ID=MMETSP1101-20121128/21524_1 /TAXON_ID=46948 /ORGANISM="Rhodomonas abbreviata, Strain Caron Lab Isolate" /LENGTH=176 /DNA_ID=CAMNT_0023434943 /DNA_START=6 /DNA_END=536 /DNA_ORIENTATION=+